MALTNYVLMPGADYQALCNAIRAKTGKTETLKSGDLASEVESITDGGDPVTITEFLQTSTFTNDYFSDFGVFVYFIPLEAEMMAAWVENRNAVTVVYDGEEYNLTPQVLTGADGSDGVCVGNLSAFGGTGNNEPFAVVPWNIDDVVGLLIGSTVDTAPTEHTIRIYQEASVSMEGVYTVTFMSEDGSSVLYERLVVDGDDCANVVDRGLLVAPTKASTAQYNYTHSGWSLTKSGSASASALKSVTADRTVYAAFTSAVRYYTITYYDSDGTTVLRTDTLPYGETPNYMPEKEGLAFTGWTPSITVVVGNATYTAQWKTQETLNDFSWEALAAMPLEEVQQRFKVGDRKSLNGDIFYATLVGFAHDDLADGSGKANMTFIINYPSYPSSNRGIYGAVGDWSSCAARDWFENNASTAVYLQDISPYAKRVNKDYVTDVNTGATAKSSDLFWMPSMTELGYTATGVPAEGRKYEIFTAKATTSENIELNGSYHIIGNSAVYPKTQTRSLYLTDSAKYWAFTNRAPATVSRAYDGRGYYTAAFCI